MKTWTRWQDWVAAVAGAYTALAPIWTETGSAATATLLAERLAASHERSRLVRAILWREADTHPEVARCMHTFHDELVELATQVIALADPEGADPTRRHAAALAWTGTIPLALNTARLGGVEHDLPVVAALLAAGLRPVTP